MPANIPAIISEGRRLIAEATADRVLPLEKVVSGGYNTLIEADGTPLARADEDGCGFVEDCAVDVVAFAVAHLAALLDVAEASERYRDARAYAHGLNEVIDGPETDAAWDAVAATLAALDAALAKLREVL